MEVRIPMMLTPTRVRFLNEERELESAEDWKVRDGKKNWYYNLHYFDDLNARGAAERRQWHENLIHHWIAENPPGKGVGWDPYPLSVRIMNWIKWALKGNVLSQGALNSLALQIRYLRKRYDYDLLGNHLLVNGKAFVFAGLFFKGSEADRWLQKGLKILTHQIPEQILEDGGHFELCPMYHNLILEDFLDVLNLLRVYGRENYFRWQAELDRMRRWALAMSHPDGEIALFNDAGFGIALTTRELEEYAIRLGLPPIENDIEDLMHLRQSGYVRATRGQAILFADVGPTGPDYLPGHAHADSLSFELSLYGHRFIVDSGTSLYDITPERLRQRGTGAHNTLQVNGQDSSEVWSSFRIARRARIRDVKVSANEHGLRITAAHDGYSRLPGCGLHRRTWLLSDKELLIFDDIEGQQQHEMRLPFHFHPEVNISQKDSRTFEASLKGRPLGRITMDEKLSACVEKSTYHPEFGISLENQKLVGTCRGKLPMCFISRFVWAQGGGI